MSARSLVVLSGGLSQPSSTRLLADQLAAATVAELQGHSVDVEVRVVELRDVARDVTNHLLTGFASPELQRELDVVNAADAVIAVTPIFSASYSGLFKSFVDVLHRDALADVPVLVAATGGTARHSLALEHAMRPLFSYLRAVVVPTAVYAASEDWGTAGSAQSSLAGRIGRAAGELAREVSRREPRAVADAFDAPTPFEQLLSG